MQLPSRSRAALYSQAAQLRGSPVLGARKLGTIVPQLQVSWGAGSCPLWP